MRGAWARPATHESRRLPQAFIGARQVTAKLVVRSTTVVRALTIVAAILLLLSVAGQFSKYALGHGYLKGLVPLFYVDAERNVPTYFSVLLLLGSSALLFVCAMLGRGQADSRRYDWLVLAAGFLFMGYDEAFQVHETFNSPVRAALGEAAAGFWYFAWVVPGMLTVAFIGLLMMRLLGSLPPATRIRFLLAASVYLGGALAVEMLGGWHAESYGQENPVYSAIATLEEGLEIAGLILFIRALLLFLEGSNGSLEIRVQA